MAKARLDRANPPAFLPEEWNRLAHMSGDEVERNAAADVDNPPLTEQELARVASARSVQAIRRERGLSQAAFARMYGISISRLRDWEQGRFTPDTMARAYLYTIRYEPEAVARALQKSVKGEAR